MDDHKLLEVVNSECMKLWFVCLLMAQESVQQLGRVLSSQQFDLRSWLLVPVTSQLPAVTILLYHNVINSVTTTTIIKTLIQTKFNSLAWL